MNKTYLIDGVRVVLGLETEGGVLGVGGATLALEDVLGRQVVGRVQLHPRLVRVHLQDTPTPRMHHPEYLSFNRYIPFVKKALTWRPKRRRGAWSG